MIVEAGRLTPSACNSQPWHFIVIDEPDAKDRLCDALVLEGGQTGCAWRKQVPAFLVLCEVKAEVMPLVVEHFGTTQRFAAGDVGAAAMNMCHQAMDLGLSTCILGMSDREKLKQSFGIPDDCEVRLVLAVGYEDKTIPAQVKIRKPLEEICGFNHW